MLKDTRGGKVSSISPKTLNTPISHYKPPHVCPCLHWFPEIFVFLLEPCTPMFDWLPEKRNTPVYISHRIPSPHPAYFLPRLIHSLLLCRTLQCPAMSCHDMTCPTQQSLDVDYVLVIFGGVTGYSSDDINKFLWPVRIGSGVFADDMHHEKVLLVYCTYPFFYIYIHNIFFSLLFDFVVLFNSQFHYYFPLRDFFSCVFPYLFSSRLSHLLLTAVESIILVLCFRVSFQVDSWVHRRPGATE